MALAESGRAAVLAEPDGSAAQLWRLVPRGEGYAVLSASGLALDDSSRRTTEGNRVSLYEPNGTPAQTWLLSDPAIPHVADDGDYCLALAMASCELRLAQVFGYHFFTEFCY